MTGFFDMQKNDTDVKDIRWVAYIMATTYHETTYSFKPIKEDGEGKDYGKEITVVDSKGLRGKVGNTYKNVYYGRGYVQLTWDYNYEDVGKAIGLGDKLYINPDLALEAKNAYKIASYGMRYGTFTKKHKLSDHITSGKTDYVNARRIINGEDKKSK